MPKKQKAVGREAGRVAAQRGRRDGEEEEEKEVVELAGGRRKRRRRERRRRRDDIPVPVESAVRCVSSRRCSCLPPSQCCKSWRNIAIWKAGHKRRVGGGHCLGGGSRWAGERKSFSSCKCLSLTLPDHLFGFPALGLYRLTDWIQQSIKSTATSFCTYIPHTFPWNASTILVWLLLYYILVGFQIWIATSQMYIRKVNRIIDIVFANLFDFLSFL